MDRGTLVPKLKEAIAWLEELPDIAAKQYSSPTPDEMTPTVWGYTGDILDVLRSCIKDAEQVEELIARIEHLMNESRGNYGRR